MEYMTPNFTKDMVKTHKILIPNMAVTQFRLMQAALASEGYQTEVLGNCGSEVAQLGLKYVHNDTCYPALLVIGQFLDALNSGKYDLEHTALLITQTGGGCRASNYIKLLRKALVKAGYGNIPVASLNFSGLEKGSGLPLTVPLLRKVIASIFYGDMLVALRSQTHAYENHKGDADAMTEKWIATIQGWIRDNKNYSAHDMKKRFYDIAADYATIPITRVPKVKVGVVGEIYVKYSPLGNNDLEKFLESQDCEVNLPGLMGFVEYCVANYKLDIDLYGGNKLVAGGADAFLSWLDGIGCASYDAMRNPTGVSYYGVDGKPVSVAGGFSSVKYKYNGQNQRTETTYFGTDGRAVDCANGWHREVYTYKDGAEHTVTLYNKAGRKLATGTKVNGEWKMNVQGMRPQPAVYSWRDVWRELAKRCPAKLDESVVVEKITVGNNSVTLSYVMNGATQENVTVEVLQYIRNFSLSFTGNFKTPSYVDIHVIVYDQNHEYINSI